MFGVSLVEVLIVISLVGVLTLAIAPQMRSGRQVWEVVGDRHADVLQNARIGMRKITRELRQSLSINVIGSDYVEFVDRNDDDMRFQYSAQYLEYGAPGSMSVLAGPVDSLSFTYYQEDGVTTTTTLEEIKAVLIQLVTSDSEGKVPSIPLSSLVYIRKDPDIVYTLAELAMFGSAGIVIWKTTTITGSMASDSAIDVGNNAIINGDVMVETLDDLDIDGGAIFNGTASADHDITLPDASEFTAGDTDVTINNGETLELEPGLYGDFYLKNNTRLVLESGDYYFNSISIPRGSTGKNFVLDVPSDGNVRIFVVGDVELGSGMQIAIDGTITSASSEAAREKASEIYIEILGAWDGGVGGEWLGMIFAPNGDINMQRGSYIAGALYSGQSIIIGNGSTIYFVATNNDLLPPQFSL